MAKIDKEKSKEALSNPSFSNVKNLNYKDCKILCHDLRNKIIDVVSKNGGQSLSYLQIHSKRQNTHSRRLARRRHGRSCAPHRRKRLFDLRSAARKGNESKRTKIQRFVEKMIFLCNLAP